MSRDGRVRRAVVFVLVVAPVVAAGVWSLIWLGTRLGHDPLPCNHNCPPEGGAYAPVPATGIVLNVILGLMVIPVLRLLGVGITIGLGSLAAVMGWHAAVADGRLSVEAASGSVGFWRVVAIVGAVLAVIGLLYEVRMPGPVWRLFGWVPAPARLDEHTSGTAVVTFTDRDGIPRRSVVPARQQWHDLPVRAWFVARDPSRVRIAPALGYRSR